MNASRPLRYVAGSDHLLCHSPSQLVGILKSDATESKQAALSIQTFAYDVSISNLRRFNAYFLLTLTKISSMLLTTVFLWASPLI